MLTVCPLQQMPRVQKRVSLPDDTSLNYLSNAQPAEHSSIQLATNDIVFSTSYKVESPGLGSLGSFTSISHWLDEQLRNPRVKSNVTGR